MLVLTLHLHTLNHLIIIKYAHVKQRTISQKSPGTSVLRCNSQYVNYRESQIEIEKLTSIVLH